MATDPKTQAVAAITKSGFPFQMRLANIVSELPKWTLRGQETSWTDDQGLPQFLDITAESDRLMVVIECKKTKDRSLSFLAADPSLPDVDLSHFPSVRKMEDSTRRAVVAIDRWQLKPGTGEASFVADAGSDTSGEARLLENEIRKLVAGTVAFASYLWRRPGWNGDPYPVIPVYVTNSPLFRYQFSYDEVSLDRGELPVDPSRIVPVKYIRFTKSFLASQVKLPYQTVFVTSATDLAELLTRMVEYKPYPDKLADSVLMDSLRMR